MSEQNSDNLKYTPYSVVSYDGTELVYRHDMVRHWWNNEIYYGVLNLPLPLRDQYFQMLTEYVEVIKVVYGSVIHPLLDYITGTPFKTINEFITEDEKVDYLKIRDMIAAYDEWKHRTGR